MNKSVLFVIWIILFNSKVFANNQISNIITPVRYFVNHVEQLRQLKGFLYKYNQVSIVGASGMGKSQLVRTYCHKNKNDYQLVWFVDCNLDINSELLKLAKRINEVSNNTVIQENVLSIRKDLMAYLSDKNNWLLVFDNLKINDNAKIRDFIDWDHNGNIIFCSQYSEFLPNPIRMTTFNKKDTNDIVDQILEYKNHKISDFLIAEFKGYPILTVQGAQLLKEIKGLSMDIYKQKLNLASDKIKCNIELAINSLSPNAKELAYKIALVNNQACSKNFLASITSNKATLDSDIYELSKLMLILNTGADETNPIFEMHDILADEIRAINGDHNNKILLESIIESISSDIPQSIVKSHIFRQSTTVLDNLEVISKNSNIYNVDLHKIAEFNLQLLTRYVNSLDLYNADRFIDWFNKNDKDGSFTSLFSFDNIKKKRYAEYLAIIGGYYRRLTDYNKAIIYYLKAKVILDELDGHYAIKSNISLCLAKSYLALGKIKDAENIIAENEKILAKFPIDEGDIGLLHFAKARLFFAQGKYNDALFETDTAIDIFIKNGVKIDDIYLTGPYHLRSAILNLVGKHDAAYVQAKQLYDMNFGVKKVDHEIFARIFTQMAQAKLGLGNADQAMDYVNKAVSIFLHDEKRNPKSDNFLYDPDLAFSYVVQGDIFVKQNKLKQALESYRNAQNIYAHLYKENNKNIEQVSYLYMQGAKAACMKRDKYYYECFAVPQLEEFGINHPNTKAIVSYCSQYDVNFLEE